MRGSISLNRNISRLVLTKASSPSRLRPEVDIHGIFHRLQRISQLTSIIGACRQMNYNWMCDSKKDLLTPESFDQLSCKRQKFSTTAAAMDDQQTGDKPSIDSIADTELFKSLFTPEFLELKRISDENNMQVRIAGGAVRDLLMGIEPHDVDFATIVKPDKMKEIFAENEVRVIDYGSRATEHGTILVRINDKENYEITTTRKDVVTDGRHASVEFHEDWKEDANRRDLTINSMFLGLDGKLYDFFGGYDDLIKKRVRFVGDADARITEDYLRIMRYFRFYGKIEALPSIEGHDEETLNCIRKNASGLKGVSGERIWVELKKILKGPFAHHQMKLIVDLGVAEQIGLPADCNPEDFGKVYSRTKDDFRNISESALLASLLRNQSEVDELHKRLKLSKVELTTIQLIVDQRDNYKKGEDKYYKNLIIDHPDKKQCLIRCIQLAAYMTDKSTFDALSSWEIPRMPFSAKFLIDLGVPKGKKMSQIINRVKELWKEGGFKVDDDGEKRRLEEEATRIAEEIRNAS